MPEGDSVFSIARSLRAALQGATVTRVATTVGQVRALGPARLVGQTVADVESRGKHLLVWFAPSDLALRTHLGMNGSWHLYRPGERWGRAPHLARVVLGVTGHEAVCFAAAVVVLSTRARTDADLAALGPDPLGATADLQEARRRLDERADVAIGAALLDQRVLAGVGNVYRSEVCFLQRVDPRTPVADVPAATRDALLATAAALLRHNARPGSVGRTTTSDPRLGRLNVYGRAGLPCPRCATPIAVARVGRPSRVAYWCPRCQAPAARR